MERPPRLTAALVCILLIGLVGHWAWWAYSDAAHADKVELPACMITNDSMAVTYTHDGEMIWWYVMIDLDSGV